MKNKLIVILSITTVIFLILSIYFCLSSRRGYQSLVTCSNKLAEQEELLIKKDLTINYFLERI